MSHDQSTLCRTRPWLPDMGFLTTIQNIIEVAKLSAYLRMKVSRRFASVRRMENVPCEDILRVVIPQIHSRRSTNRYTQGLALIVCEQIRRYIMLEIPKYHHCFLPPTYSSSPPPKQPDSHSTPPSPRHSEKTTSPSPAHCAA
jgi:hypothetical protein